MCFSKIFDLSGSSKRVLGSDKFVHDNNDDNDDNKNNDFWWCLNLKKFFKTHLKIVKSVINNLKPHWNHFHWWWSLGSWWNDDGDA